MLASSGADPSAIQTRTDEAATDTSPTRVTAESAALHAQARERRCTTALLAAGYSSQQIDAAKVADQWRPVIAKLTTAERAGIAPAAATTVPSTEVTSSLSRLDDTLSRWIDRRRQHGPEGDRSRTRWADELQLFIETLLAQGGASTIGRLQNPIGNPSGC